MIIYNIYMQINKPKNPVNAIIVNGLNLYFLSKNNEIEKTITAIILILSRFPLRVVLPKNAIKIIEEADDAIRPMVSEEIISDCIKTCKEYGSAITSIPCAEAMLYSTDKLKSDKIISRDELLRTQTPQAFTIGKLKSAHEEALKKGITNSVASCTLMIELGERVYFSKGSEKNIKLTTAEDFEIFRALLTAKNADWFKQEELCI